MEIPDKLKESSRPVALSYFKLDKVYELTELTFDNGEVFSEIKLLETDFEFSINRQLSVKLVDGKVKSIRFKGFD